VFCGHTFHFGTEQSDPVLVFSDFENAAISGTSCLRMAELQALLAVSLGLGDHYYFVTGTENVTRASEINVASLGLAPRTSTRGRSTRGRASTFTLELRERSLGDNSMAVLIEALRGQGSLYSWADGRIGVSFESLRSSLLNKLGRPSVLTETSGESEGVLWTIAGPHVAKLVIYLHAHADNQDAWTRVKQTFSQAGMSIVPAEPTPVAADAEQAQQVRQRRVEAMRACDAVLLIAARTGRDLDADLVAIGKNDRASVRAQSNLLLPCAVLDLGASDVGTPARKEAARNLGVDWIDATQPDWPVATLRWLATVSPLERDNAIRHIR